MQILGALLAVALVGDRLVVNINNVPYTQRQAEAYISIKEALRRTDGDAVRLIDARNWKDALEVFSEDMIILQESERLGSYQGEIPQTEKFYTVVRDKMAKNAPLRDTLARLGLDEPGLQETLTLVLRVAAFRRGKDRQAQIVGQKDAGDGQSAARWLADLAEKTVLRHYESAKEYVPIEPRAANAR